MSFFSQAFSFCVEIKFIIQSTCGFWLTIILITKSFLLLICFRKLWLWNPGAYWSRNKVWPNYRYLWHGFLCGPWSSWIQCGTEKKSQGPCGISTQDYQGRVHEVVPAKGMSKALNIHTFNKSGGHLEFLIYDVIRGKTSAAIFEFWLAWQYYVGTRGKVRPLWVALFHSFPV